MWMQLICFGLGGMSFMLAVVRIEEAVQLRNSEQPPANNVRYIKLYLPDLKIK